MKKFKVIKAPNDCDFDLFVIKCYDSESKEEHCIIATSYFALFGIIDSLIQQGYEVEK